MNVTLLSFGGSSPVAAASGTTVGPANVNAALHQIESSPRYRQSDWGYSVVDEEAGRTLASQNPQHLFDPGSTMKLYTIATVLRLYGPNYRFRTPVYRVGTLTGSTLTGNLVLVASGDLSLGLREEPNGTLYYENLPKLDQSYADVGLPGAVEPPGNPLTGLNQLAAQVRASGITHVNGNVVIDDRLFAPYNGFPDGLISSMWVNENLIDVLVTPGAVGSPASINWRPMTASYTVENKVTTVAATGSTTLAIVEPVPGHLVVTGQIAAKSQPTLVVHEVDDPSAFARTAFIEALQRAGVAVTAAATGPNPEGLLPPKGGYLPADMLGEHVSATLSQFASLILKVSYNRGADLMTCLSAVREGSTDCEQGLVAEVKTVSNLGISSTSVYPFDGAGSDDQGRSTPAAMAAFLRRDVSQPTGLPLFNALPVLDRSGTLANTLPNSAAAGHAQIKTGNRIVGTAAGQLLLLGNSLAGYIETRSGRHVTFMIAVGNVPLTTPIEVESVTTDQARMVAAIYRDF